jgi:hypothetical protein
MPGRRGAPKGPPVEPVVIEEEPDPDAKSDMDDAEDTDHLARLADPDVLAEVERIEARDEEAQHAARPD